MRDRGFERERRVEGRHRSEGEGRRYALAGGGKEEGGRAALQLSVLMFAAISPTVRSTPGGLMPRAS